MLADAPRQWIDDADLFVKYTEWLRSIGGERQADTIRKWFADAVPRNGDDALDALLAEYQRLRDELTATEKLSQCEHERRVEAVAESELLCAEYKYWRNRAHTAERSLREALMSP